MLEVERVDFASVPTRDAGAANTAGLALRDPDGNVLILHRRYAAAPV